jgi:hypothetical protein
VTLLAACVWGSVEPTRLLLEDTIIGKAATVLMHRLEFRTV